MIPCMLTAVKYVKILKSQLMPSVHRLSNGKYIFMQGNDPKHTVKVKEDFLSRKISIFSHGLHKVLTSAL